MKIKMQAKSGGVMGSERITIDCGGRGQTHFEQFEVLRKRKRMRREINSKRMKNAGIYMEGKEEESQKRRARRTERKEERGQTRVAPAVLI